MQSERDRSVGWTRAMSLASVNSSTPSSVLLHSAVPADYHLIFTHPPLFATEPRWPSSPDCVSSVTAAG